jgi:3-oxoacyl-[acyl-carrier-protein] synthase-3
MVASRIDGVCVRGIVGCVPDGRETVADLARRFGEEAARKVAAATGIEERRIVAPGQCTSDLAEAAARRLLDGLGWEPDSIDLLVLVTQTHDQTLPGTASLLHRRLGLRKGAAVLDITHGCSGLWAVGRRRDAEARRAAGAAAGRRHHLAADRPGRPGGRSAVRRWGRRGGAGA